MLIANSRITYSGKDYKPGDRLPKADAGTEDGWIKVGLAVGTPSEKAAAPEKTDAPDPAKAPDSAKASK